MLVHPQCVPFKDGAGLGGRQTCVSPSGFKGSKEPFTSAGLFVTTEVSSPSSPTLSCPHLALLLLLLLFSCMNSLRKVVSCNLDCSWWGQRPKKLPWAVCWNHSHLRAHFHVLLETELASTADSGLISLRRLRIFMLLAPPPPSPQLPTS